MARGGGDERRSFEIVGSVSGEKTDAERRSGIKIYQPGLAYGGEFIEVLARFWSAIASMLYPGYMPLKYLSLRAPP